jgi:hypothetical protein
MSNTLWSGIKSIFGFQGVGETALKIVEKISGTDFTSKEKADYILKYMEQTKYQSPTRRLLATLYMSEQIMLVTVWICASAAHRLLEHSGAGLLASDINAFLQSNVNINMGLIISFYFILGVKK